MPALLILFIVLFGMYKCDAMKAERLSKLPPLTNEETKKCFTEMTAEEFEDECSGRKVLIDEAYFIKFNHFAFAPGINPEKFLDGDFAVDYESQGVSLLDLKHDQKVRVQGKLDDSKFAGVTNARVELFDHLDGSTTEDSKQEQPHQSPEEWAAANRMNALMEQADGDAELAKYASDKRAEYKLKAINFKSMSLGGGAIVDSYEFAGDVFLSCMLSYPGPIYECEETASPTP